jgi:hypothetical protein
VKEGFSVAISANLLATAGIDTRLLDCWEVTLAMGLVARGHRDVRSVLGSQWWFDFTPDRGAVPRPDVAVGVAVDFVAVEDRCASLAGLRPYAQWVGEGELVETCRRALALGRTPMVVTDAYLLPWCPYAGRKHVAHSFLVTGTTGSPVMLQVVDGYDNRTEWGDARPLETVADDALVTLMERDPTTKVVTLLPEPAVEAFDRLAWFRGNLSILADWATAGPYDEFIARHCHADVDLSTFDDFCEACWTIERRRGLYGTWLDDLAAEPGSPIPVDLADRFRAKVVTRWSDVNRFAYLALRRMRGGRRALGGVADLVAAAAAAERELAAEFVAEFSVPGMSPGMPT